MASFAFDESDDDDFNGFDASTNTASSLRASGVNEFTESDIEVSDVSSSDSDSPTDEDDHDDRPTDAAAVKWKTDLQDVHLQPFDDSDVGPRHGLGVGARFIDYFLLLIPVHCIAMICIETKRYATQLQETLGKLDAAWVPVDTADIRVFVGVLIIMGIQRLPQLHCYWSSDEALGNPAIKKAMSHNRFMKIRQYFHLTDRSKELQKGDAGYDRLQKIRPFLKICQKTFRFAFNPALELSVDEGMKFKGRLGFIQYIPMKPTKRGIKVWMLASPANGYVHELDVYCDKSDGMYGEHGLGYGVVMKLTEPYHNRGHHVYYDNFFSSVNLLIGLLEKGTYACATTRSNRRGYPLKDVGKLRRGESKFLQSSDCSTVACAWQNKRTVHILSSTSNPDCGYLPSSR